MAERRAAMEHNVQRSSLNQVRGGREKRSSSVWGRCNGLASSAYTPTSSTTSARADSGDGAPRWRWR